MNEFNLDFQLRINDHIANTVCNVEFTKAFGNFYEHSNFDYQVRKSPSEIYH